MSKEAVQPSKLHVKQMVVFVTRRYSGIWTMCARIVPVQILLVHRLQFLWNLYKTQVRLESTSESLFCNYLKSGEVVCTAVIGE